MSRKAPQITCSEEDRRELERLAASRTEPKAAVERAKIILGCLAGRRVEEVARHCHTRPNTVIKWRQRFVQRGLAGLADAARPGAKPAVGGGRYDGLARRLGASRDVPAVGAAVWIDRLPTAGERA